jgi:imidazolonepropionase-like amidohydrolase
MMRRMILLGLALLGSMVVAAEAPGPVAFVGGTVISPGDPPSRFIGTIVVEGTRIAQAGPEARVKVPRGAQVIDVRGKFVIPGLIDVHHHLGTGTLGRSDADPAKNLGALLTWGVTTVFNTGITAESLAALKLATKADDAPYARFFSSGRIFGAKGGWAGDYIPATAEEARANVREAKASGVDAIKLVFDDMSWLTKKPLVVLQPDVMRAIIDEAHAQGLRAYVHAPILGFAKEALRAGADGFVHGIISDPVDAEFIELMRKNRAYYTATMAVYEACADIASWSRTLQAFDDSGRIPSEAYEAMRAPDAVARWEKYWTNTAYTKERLPVLRGNLKRLSEAGVPIAAGTDTGVPGVVLGVASQIELLLHVDAGLSAAAALRAATTTAAQMIGAGDLGAIEPGRQADLVVLDADPLADIRNVRRISRVMKAGIWVLPGESVAGNLGVPVHERAAGVFLPGPDMQRVERREPEAIGTLEQVKKLSHELRRSGVLLMPRLRENEIIGADQPQAAVRHRLVNHYLRTRGVQHAIGDQRQVHEVHPHGPHVGSADAAE